MAYTPEVWSAGAPAITAARLNNMETGVDVAHQEIDARLALVGFILPFTGPSAAIPTGWLACEGQAISRSTYSALFAKFSTTYGAGDGSTTFNLPDLRDRFPVGAGSDVTLGEQGGDLFHDHGSSGSESSTHTHSVGVAATSSNPLELSVVPATGASASDGHGHSGGSSTSGSGGGHATIAEAPGFASVPYIVKAL